MSGDLASLKLDNSFVRELPGDPDPSNARRQVLGACYSRVHPTPVARPTTLAYSREVAAMLGLSEATCESREFAEVFAGNRLVRGMDPYAACYGGHQFGSWAGQLGDGRAITLGEALLGEGRRLELQLKGAGLTPYSRTADGRAVVRSSVREFLCSEAMHHLGVPTTRALSLVATGEEVVRDMFYDGHPRAEPGAVVCRVAPSFLRFGNFEIFAARGDLQILKALADYAIRTHFPSISGTSAEAYVRWFDEVCRTTTVMIAHWMRVGFVHGVMNTDNMSILGLTIDYGPYGWLEGYDPDWTPNTTDAGGRRYRYGYQPMIAMWNLSRFGGALLPLVDDSKELEGILNEHARRLDAMQARDMAAKCGFDSTTDDDGLVAALPEVLTLVETDMTIFFRRLADVAKLATEHATVDDGALLAPLLDAYYDPAAVEGDVLVKTLDWLRRYAARVRDDGVRADVRSARMNAINPKYVLRNYLAQLVIDKAEQGDASMLHELLDVLRAPYGPQPEREPFAAKRPEWARNRAGCSMLSCSS